MVTNYETWRSYENALENLKSELSDLNQKIRGNKNSTEASTNELEETDIYDNYPYINEQDYKMYFAPETYNFKQFNIGACRFVSSIYGITRMKSYKNLIINSVKKIKMEIL